MTTRGPLLMRWIRWSGRTVVLLGFTAGVVVLLLWLAGQFAAKVPARNATAQPQASDVEGRLAAGD